MVIACSTSGAGNASDDAGLAVARDATLDSASETSPPDDDAGPKVADATVDGAKASAADSGPDGGCFAGSYELDSGPDADADTCLYSYECGLSGTGLGNVGCQILLVAEDGSLEPFPANRCWLPQDAGCDDDVFAPGAGGAITIECTPCVGGGRRPTGLRRPRARARRGGLTDYLARMTFEEDASIAAFARMHVELAALGAPAELVSAAACATRDEERHRRAMKRLAVARGADPREIAKARVRRSIGRRAAVVAAENAAEGCVRETFGALVARWQSLHARDVDLRRAFARIARDEVRHAALSWAVARWLEPKLDAAGQRRAARARVRALVALRSSAAVEPSRDIVHAAGLPSATNARTLLGVMTRELSITRAPARRPSNAKPTRFEKPPCAVTT